MGYRVFWWPERFSTLAGFLSAECYTPPEKYYCLLSRAGTADGFQRRLPWMPWNRRFRGHCCIF